jgi:hypothetical protein
MACRLLSSEDFPLSADVFHCIVSPSTGREEQATEKDWDRIEELEESFFELA